MALSSAKTAMDYGRDVARDVSEQLREKYPEGVFVFSSERGQKVDCTSIESEGIHSLEVRLTNGDIQICFSEDPQAPVEITGDTEEIETIRREDGALIVRQGSTASSSFLFTRGVRSTDIIVRLPNRAWNNISLATVNGDIRIDEGLECNGLAVQSTSGDMRAAGLTSGRMSTATFMRRARAGTSGSKGFCAAAGCLRPAGICGLKGTARRRIAPASAGMWS